jgi:hypothetical protein
MPYERTQLHAFYSMDDLFYQDPVVKIWYVIFYVNI